MSLEERKETEYLRHFPSPREEKQEMQQREAASASSTTFAGFLGRNRSRWNFCLHTTLLWERGTHSVLKKGLKTVTDK